MTQWGMLLLCSFIVLGATGRISWRKSGRIALVLTGIVMTVVVIGYARKTPNDKYIRSIDSTIYATGNTYPVGWGNGTKTTPSTEDTSGIQAATWQSTDHSSAATGSSSATDSDGN
jgi:hypothetical protein